MPVRWRRGEHLKLYKAEKRAYKEAVERGDISSGNDDPGYAWPY